MRLIALCLLSATLVQTGFDVAFAQNVSEGGEDVSIRLKGTPTVYVQKTRVEVLELRGDRKDPNFVERSWASARTKAQENIDRGPEKIQTAPPKEVAEPPKSIAKTKKQGVNKGRAPVEAESKRPAKRTKANMVAQKQPNRAPAGFGPIIKISKATELKGTRIKD